jgi:hypothetical protein
MFQQGAAEESEIRAITEIKDEANNQNSVENNDVSFSELIILFPFF